MRAVWYFDFISPFSYLQLAKLQEWRKRIEITPKPIVFGGVLKRHGQLGPAEIPGKREFTYRFVHWQAQREGIRLRFPPSHPFNPIPALRLCIAAGGDWPVVAAVFDHLWRDGCRGDDAAELDTLGRRLGVGDVAAAIADERTKATLRSNTDEAIAAGVFGVPTLQLDEELYWGNDASAMVDERLDRGMPFDDAEYARLAALPSGIERRR